MSRSLPKVDVVIIGLGAAGGIASYVLTKAGINVVGLEAGPRLDRGDFIKGLDEISGGYLRNALGEPKFNKEIPTWRPNERTKVTQSYGASGMVNAVGGTSIHYSEQSWRFRTDDFRIRSTIVDTYGEAGVPNGSAVVDWPVTYDEIEPYYDNVERLIGVSGKGGSNPFESPRNRDYPMPPLAADGYSEMMADAMTSLGYHPFPKPAAVASQEYNGRPACTYCGFCTGYGCWNDSKSSTLVSAIAEAEKTGKLEIRPGSRVMKILTNDKGAATAVQYIDGQGEIREQPAGLIILSSYIFENNRLLMLSASPSHPQGIGNGHGQLGKYFMAHQFVTTYGYFAGLSVNKGGGLIAQGLAMDDLDGENFDHAGLGFVRGSLIFPLSSTETQPIGSSRTITPDAPAWGSGYKRWLHENANSVVGVMAQSEFLPYEANYLDLDPSATDAAGVPVIRATFDAYDNEKRQAEYMTGKLKEILGAMGVDQSWGFPVTPNPVNTHGYGGTRMGDDPSESVVNKYGLVHDAPNLCVLGGSTFCSTAGYNPTETIQALAWYAADHIAVNLSALAV